MLKIKIESEQEFFDSFEWSTCNYKNKETGKDVLESYECNENKEYLKDEWKRIIENEEEKLEEIINNNENSLEMARIIKDNQGETEITAELNNNVVIGNLVYWTEITL